MYGRANEGHQVKYSTDSYFIKTSKKYMKIQTVVNQIQKMSAHMLEGDTINEIGI